MSRVKRGVHHSKRRRGILLKTKGFEAGRKNLMKVAKVAATKAGSYAYRDRRVKKRVNRGLWQVNINAALTAFDTSYSKFMGMLTKANIKLNRKVLAEIATERPEVFAALVKAAK